MYYLLAGSIAGTAISYLYCKLRKINIEVNEYNFARYPSKGSAIMAMGFMFGLGAGIGLYIWELSDRNRVLCRNINTCKRCYP